MDKIFTPIKKRILNYIDNQGIIKEKFFELTGIASSNFKGNGLKSEIGGEKIVKILSIYPEINPDWLLTGRGEMLRSEVQEVVEVVKPPPVVSAVCVNCGQKDKIIRLLEENNQLLKDKLKELQNAELMQLKKDGILVKP